MVKMKRKKTILDFARKGYPIAVKKFGKTKTNKMGILKLAKIGKKKK